MTMPGLEINICQSHQLLQFVQNDIAPLAPAVAQILQQQATPRLTLNNLLETTFANNIYRGILTVSGQNIFIVAKMSRDEGDIEGSVFDLREEAMMYSGVLKLFQGEVVPLFYGLYEGQMGGRHLACIVLEDCGDPYYGDIRDLDLPTKLVIPIIQSSLNFISIVRLTIYEKYRTLHQDAHIIHQNAESLHILLSQSPEGYAVRIISLRCITQDHGCEWSVTPSPDKTRPDEGVSCGELFFLVEELGIWHNRTIPPPSVIFSLLTQPCYIQHSSNTEVACFVEMSVKHAKHNDGKRLMMRSWNKW
jgi:hypothetical protein